ncbi:hypothetical protein HMPREF1531_01719 [Propionibacterium sp. oral taxon 192 str. F0372]|uniref:ABC transporter permease n=1 Tax=Propionibacterium sp. oral taxon 192 TaxID=671222 RepID=UPI000353FF52|nr:ABC transporter permease [Propionibacterium sp. oral taxon 192]EPH02413.1 hypothetical protein HMPREF1531_01719 [Propionibacterium sp. oral taxon 192 str. F0372]
MNTSWATIARREIMVKLTDKSFIISTIVSLAVTALAFAGVQIFANRSTTTDIVVTDQQAAAIVQGTDSLVRKKNAKSSVNVVEVSSDEEAEHLVSAGDADAWLRQADGSWQLVWKTESKTSLEQSVDTVIKDLTLSDLARQAGLSDAELQARMSVESVTLEGDSNPMIGSLTGLAFAALFMFSSLVYGMQIANSVVEEKQSRIVEILVSVVPVRALLAGKVIGQTAMAVGQMVLLLGLGLIGLSATKLSVMLPNLSGAVAWFLVFFLAGFLALACIWAAAGSLGTRTEDVQYSAQPLTFVLMAVYVAGFTASGTAKVVLSYVPIMSAVLMPARIMDNTAQWWEPVIALVINLLFAALMVSLGSRIYRRALMQTSGRLSYRAALRLSD